MDIFLKIIKILLAPIIEFLIIIPIILFVIYMFESYGGNNKAILIFMTIVPIAMYVVYLLFSNTKYISLSSFILRYRLKAENHIVLRILISNILYYTLFFLYYWVAASEEKNLILYYLLQFIVLIEISGCFFPKIRNRLSLYFLRIKWEAPQIKKLPNDGILL